MTHDDSPRVAIGVVCHQDPHRVTATLETLRAYTPMPHELWLLGDGPDAETKALLDSWAPARTSYTEDARGMAACLNRLAAESNAPVLALIEAGSLVSPEWLERLLKALDAHPANGLAGPSTNQCWNEQQIFRGAGNLAIRARQTGNWFANVLRTLEPLYSLADFCYLVRREVIDAIGPADEAYGLGPCWEMDFNIRAARAGWRGIWAGSAYVERMPVDSRRQHYEAALFERNRRLYQSKFCARQLNGTATFFRSHCRGDECPNFAPQTAAQLIPANFTTAPLVTCMMPTYNRREWIARSIANFLMQDFRDCELLILDDGSDPVADQVPPDPRVRYHRVNHRMNLGAKRNLGCQLARGELIAHWDDDDWYPSWRLGTQVKALNESGAGVCGSSHIYFADRAAGHAWRYAYSGPLEPWVCGSAMLYRKSFWQQHPFPDLQVGEDVRFLSDVRSRRVHDLADPRLCIASIHSTNTSPKQTTGAFWHSIPLSEIDAVMRESMPLVSCIMPTYNRRAFVPLTLSAFDDQDYPNRELVIVDDGSDSVEDLAASHPRVQYHRLPRRHTVGEKRNIACSLARGQIIAHWDDDDWYAPHRLSLQIAPLVSGEADITGFDNMHLLALPGGEFWIVTSELHQRMFVGDVQGGTIVYWKQMLELGIRYPDVNLAEDAVLLRQGLQRGKRLKRLRNDIAFVYVRHGRNTWNFQTGSFLDPRGWQRQPPPRNFPESLVELYNVAANHSAAAARR